MRGIVLWALLAAAVAGLARADEATVRADVDARKLGVEDQVQFTLSVSGGDLREEPTLPPLENLRVVGGPFTQQQFSWVNGRASSSKSFTWALMPVAPGPARIGAATVRLAGGDASTQPIALEIVAGSVRPRRPARNDPFGDDPFEDFFGGRRRGPREEPKLRVEARAARSRLHVGEPLLVTYSVLTTVSIADVQFKEPPQYPGFWAEELERPESPPGGEPVTVDGQAYRRFPLLRKLLFPTRAGALTIPSATLRLGLARQSLFDAGGAVERSTQALGVTVDPIPTPAGFSGAVGRFRVSASVDKQTLAFGEAATLRVEVEGRGNLKWIERGPDVSVSGAKVYPPQSKSALRVTAEGMLGSKSWEYVVVPETAGALRVPELAFAFFDPQTQRLEEARTSALELHVAAASSAGGAPNAPAGAPAATAASGPALRADLDWRRERLPALSPRGLTLGMMLVLAAHAALALGARLQERRRLRAGRPASSRGLRQAMHDLRRAGRGDMSKEAAAAAIEKALLDAFGPLDESAATPADERERVARALLQDVQFIRYAPQLGDYSEKIREVAGRAEEALRKWA